MVRNLEEGKFFIKFAIFNGFLKIFSKSQFYYFIFVIFHLTDSSWNTDQGVQLLYKELDFFDKIYIRNESEREKRETFVVYFDTPN